MLMLRAGLEVLQCILAPPLADNLALQTLFQRQQPMPLAAHALLDMEQLKRIEPLVEQGQGAIWRPLDKPFGQRHLTEHAHLSVGGLPLLRAGFGKSSGIVGGGI